MPKKDPDMDSFVHFEGSGVVSQMLNISILITWTQCKVAGLQMQSAGPHIPFQDLNMPVRELKMIMFCWQFAIFYST